MALKKASAVLRDKAAETMSVADARVTQAEKELAAAEALPASNAKSAKVDAARAAVSVAMTERLVIARAVAQSLRDADDLEKASL